jgi:hypothetical protein
MGSVYKPRLYGSYSPEEVLAVLEDWIDWHAYRLAQTAPGQVDNLYYQDLAQEGRLAVYRLLEREPEIWAPRLLRLAILYMYAARRRGRSVFRADPHHRLRTYEQVSWEVLVDGMADGGVVEELISGEASDGDWQEGTGNTAVPSSYDDGLLVDVCAYHEDAWWNDVS